MLEAGVNKSQMSQSTLAYGLASNKIVHVFCVNILKEIKKNVIQCFFFAVLLNTLCKSLKGIFIKSILFEVETLAMKASIFFFLEIKKTNAIFNQEGDTGQGY